MNAEDSIKVAKVWLGLLAWLFFLALLVTVVVTAKVLLDGRDTLIEISSQNATDPIGIPALWFSILGWVLVAMLAFGVYSAWLHKRELTAVQ